jgi:hypothetical protein
MNDQPRHVGPTTAKLADEHAKAMLEDLRELLRTDPNAVPHGDAVQIQQIHQWRKRFIGEPLSRISAEKVKHLWLRLVCPRPVCTPYGDGVTTMPVDVRISTPVFKAPPGHYVDEEGVARRVLAWSLNDLSNRIYVELEA